MFALTPRRKENMGKTFLSLMTVDFATLVFNPREPYWLFIPLGLLFGVICFIIVMVIDT